MGQTLGICMQSQVLNKCYTPDALIPEVQRKRTRIPRWYGGMAMRSATHVTPRISNPLEATSVAMRIFARPVLKSSNACSRSTCSLTKKWEDASGLFQRNDISSLKYGRNRWISQPTCHHEYTEHLVFQLTWNHSQCHPLFKKKNDTIITTIQLLITIWYNVRYDWQI